MDDFDLGNLDFDAGPLFSRHRQPEEIVPESRRAWQVKRDRLQRRQKRRQRNRQRRHLIARLLRFFRR